MLCNINYTISTIADVYMLQSVIEEAPMLYRYNTTNDVKQSLLVMSAGFSTEAFNFPYMTENEYSPDETSCTIHLLLKFTMGNNVY